MKPSIHPPLYLLVAVIAFFLGTRFGHQTAPEPANPDASSNSVRPLNGSGTSSTEPAGSRSEVVSSDSAVAIPAESDSGAPSSTAPALPEESSPVPANSDPLARASRPSNASPPDGSGQTNAETTTDPLSDARTTKQEAAAEKQKPSGPILQTPHGAVEIFPADNPWNTDISQLPVHEYSRTWIQSIGLDKPLHPDFGTVWNGAPSGIPFVTVPPDQPRVPVKFEYPDESDPGPYPVPPNAPIEGGPNAPPDSDRHIIVLDPRNKRLYELFHVFQLPGGGWSAGSGAIFDLSSNKLRPEGWTSADAAGLPILPGLVKLDEVLSGEIRHAFRFTVRKTQRGYVHPATHWASKDNNPSLPPMGLRVRLKADYDISGFPPRVRVILTALKKYGMLLADNGSDWFLSGCPDSRWDDDELNTMKRIRGRDLECLDTGPLVRDQR